MATLLAARCSIKKEDNTMAMNVGPWLSSCRAHEKPYGQLCWLPFKLQPKRQFAEENDAVELSEVVGQPELGSECETNVNYSVRHCLRH